MAFALGVVAVVLSACGLVAFAATTLEIRKPDMSKDAIAMGLFLTVSFAALALAAAFWAGRVS